MTGVVSRHFNTELGGFLIAATESGLCFLTWSTTGELSALDSHLARYGMELVDTNPKASAHLRETALQLAEFANGERQEFDLALDLRGTEFELTVWRALRAIPFGSTVTYGELASRVGSPGGARAVGSANGKNPVPVVVPCHRVVATDGIGGFSGGLARKEELLALEGPLLF